MTLLRRISNQLERFWRGSGDPLALDWMRRGLGILLVVQAFGLLTQAEIWFGNSGWIPDSWAQSQNSVMAGFGALGIAGVRFWLPVLLLLAFSGVGMAIGFFPWLSTLLGLAALELLDCRNPLILDHTDRALHALLFVLCFFTWNPANGKGKAPLWPARLMRFQVSFFYLAVFIQQGMAGQWGIPAVVELLLSCLWIFPGFLGLPLVLIGLALKLGGGAGEAMPFSAAVMALSYLIFIGEAELRQLSLRAASMPLSRAPANKVMRKMS